MLAHEYIPRAITEVIISPLLKSSLRDPCVSANYRPISLSTAFSKILEHVILNRIERYIETSEHQFGFKKKHGTDICIYALKDVINYYRKLNTPVFLCFIDAKSAFDRVSYKKLFTLLCNRGCPKYIILILLNWYSSMELCVTWGNFRSRCFKMNNGIKQGSCISPYLYCLYVDELNIELKKSGIGCRVSNVCANNFSFADDLVVLGPDAKSVNKLLEICAKFAKKYYIEFNTIKTEAMCIHPGVTISFEPPKIYLDGAVIKYVNSFSYLGHIISNDFTDDLDIQRETRNLYIRGNTIARKFGFLDNEIKESLFKSYCYSLYASPLWVNYRLSTMNKLRVRYSNVLRKLMDVPPRSSISAVFVSNNLRGFHENRRYSIYSLKERILTNDNLIIKSMLRSDCYLLSSHRIAWNSILIRNPLSIVYLV